jgi:hypothetical protein
VVQTYDDYKGNTGHEWTGEEPDKVGDAVAADAAAADDTVAVVVAIVDGVAAAVAVAGVAVVVAAGVCGWCLRLLLWLVLRLLLPWLLLPWLLRMQDMRHCLGETVIGRLSNKFL